MFRVESGYDPVPERSAMLYAESLDDVPTQVLISPIEKVSTLAGGLQGKRVLDLGAGPGHYSVVFAQAGAIVTWHDVSQRYLGMARKRAEENTVTLNFSLGYLEDASKFLSTSFDVVFCRNCWPYCRGDRSFARLVYDLIKPGGIGYIQCPSIDPASLRGFRRLQYALNARLWWKIGHPFPPRGRIAGLFSKYSVDYMELEHGLEYGRPSERIAFVKTEPVDGLSNRGRS